MFIRLESLRGIAACLVLLYHSGFNFYKEPLSFIANSYLFVDFFFILSGFVMSHAYTRKIGQHLPFLKFIALRLGRIYPLHIVTLFIWVIYTLVKRHLYSHGLSGVIPYPENNIYTFFSNIVLLHSMGLHNELSWNYPSWSISVEFISYIFFYFFSRTFDRKSNLLFPLIVVWSCYLLLFHLDFPSFDITYDFGFVRCLGAFYLGVLIYRLKTNGFMKSFLTRNIGLLVIAVTAISIAAVTLAEKNMAIATVAIFNFALLILILTNNQGGLIGKVLEWAVLRKVGLWSYSIYMLHAVILEILFDICKFVPRFNPRYVSGFDALAVNLFALFSAIIVSKFSFEYLEMRCRNMIKRRVIESNESIPTAVLAN